MPKPLVKLFIIHVKIISNKKLQNFSIIANFDQFGILRNVVVTTENKQTLQAFFIQSVGKNSQRCL